MAATSLAGANTAVLKGTFDPEAQSLIPKGYRFVTPGSFTVATHPGQLPLADYGADSKDVVGIEPDIARLIADALGLKLVIVPVAWADWPLGLESGKYDAVLSNVTVTEERKKKFDFSSYRFDLLGIYTRRRADPEDREAGRCGRAEGGGCQHQPGPDPAAVGPAEHRGGIETSGVPVLR